MNKFIIFKAIIIFLIVFYCVKNIFRAHQEEQIINYTKNKDSPKVIKNLGNTLVCDSLKTITPKAVQNYLITEEYRVDCYDTKSQIAVDYLPEGFFHYKPNSLHNSNVDDFYKRISNQYKKNQILNDMGITHIEIPYNVDICENNICTENVSAYVRKEKILNHLRKSIVA